MPEWLPKGLEVGLMHWLTIALHLNLESPIVDMDPVVAVFNCLSNQGVVVMIVDRAKKSRDDYEEGLGPLAQVLQIGVKGDLATV